MTHAAVLTIGSIVARRKLSARTAVVAAAGASKDAGVEADARDPRWRRRRARWGGELAAHVARLRAIFTAAG